jgi:hypothetical protein
MKCSLINLFLLCRNFASQYSEQNFFFGTSTGGTGHPHHNKTVQGAEHNSSTGKRRKKQIAKYSRFLRRIQLERLKMTDWGRNM